MGKKTAISLEKRCALRSFYQNQRPKPSQRQCIEWFKQQYGHTLSQSTISESLSERFAFLDTGNGTNTDTVLCQRGGNWPDLEAALFEWHQRIEANGGITSGDLLIEGARELWSRLPQYSAQPIPTFSQGWLSNFKKRHHIIHRALHGEAASVGTDSEHDMVILRTLAGQYKEDDIYNMDETGLFWRMGPSKGLSLTSRPGQKKDKSRITIALCCNATGSDKLPPWIIGHAKAPRALRNINLDAMGIVWQANKRAWMTTDIMQRWLGAFYQHIGSREVLLVMDNFSAHASAVQLFPPPSNC